MRTEFIIAVGVNRNHNITFILFVNIACFLDSDDVVHVYSHIKL